MQVDRSPTSRPGLTRSPLALPPIYTLELEPQCELARSIAGSFRSLCRGKYTKRGWAADVRYRRREVGVIQHVGERRFEA